jgi:tetratricopeptide (TPR) repeat protein
MILMQSLRRLMSLIAVLLALWPSTAAGTERFPDKLELVGLLRDGRFDELEARLTAYQEGFEAGRISEQTVDIAFTSFEIFDPDLETKFALWSLHNPDSYAVLLARSIYYENLGWNSRGTRYAEDTSEERFAEMYDYFSRAITDLELAIEMNKKLSIAYGRLIQISTVDPELIDQDEILEDGLRAVPSSLFIRYAYMASRVPWWGGSLTEIWFFIERTTRDLPHDPNAKPLEGYYDFILGRILARDGHHKESLEYFDKALSYGEYPGYRISKGEGYYNLKLYDKARAEFEKVLQRYPQHLGALGWRAGTYRRQTRYDLALADVETAIRHNPFAPKFLSRRAYLLRKLKRFEEAERDLTKALVYGYYDEEIQYSRGTLYLHSLKNYQKAIIDLKRATLLAPESAKYWYEYASALYYTLDCDIIAALNTYLKLCADGQKCKAHGLKFAKSSLEHLSHFEECSMK